ncbi:MAG: c-type cytochrome [Bacteroidetes bacterium]|nr:c-type cytochrome [Bacteroidota bacterium]MBS1629923.1 c-type cytochrome [Bacteroidota bacterium]
MKKHLLLLGMFAAMVLASCGGNNTQSADQAEADRKASADANKAAAAPSYDPNRGEGKFTHVDIGPLNAAMASSGEKVYEVKCASCHKLTDEKLVGPGWKGVTTRHQPEWIMNFVTNTDAMLEKDPKAQAMLEICLVRMPNQNLSDQEARDILEFMRKNDGAK